MLKNTLYFVFVLMMVLVFNQNLQSQQCEVITGNINFESDNSLTFDVVIKNTGTSSFNYSHGSFAWTYDTAILNGGTATFSLVPGYSDFPADAYPPSALITDPNILRTSSNMPGSNGVIEADEGLQLYRFRLQTSAASFGSDFFNLSWKNDVTPATKIFSWDSGTGLPLEIQNLELSIALLVLEENFDYGSVANPDLTVVTTNWTRHSGVQGPAYLTTSLSYTDYISSGIGGSVRFTNGGSGTNDGDVNRILASPISGDTDVYTSFLLNLDSARTQDYFFHIAPDPLSFTYRGRVRARDNGAGWSFGLSKSSSTPVYEDTTILNFSQTYLVVLKYAMNSTTTTDDEFTLYVYDTGLPVSEPGSPVVTIGPIGSGESGDLTNVGAVAIRQGTNTPSGTIDGIRLATSWSEIFPVSGTPIISASPTSLSGFSYLVGGGPSASQSYDLSGSDLTPASGNITVTAPTDYEISLNNTIFGSTLNVPYSGGILSPTPIYVRLKSGLPGGFYENETITNEGGGATATNVICSGAVINPEPTNHVTNFDGILGNPTYYYNNLNWTDATGGTVPDGYLIKRSYVGFGDIVDPVDGVPESDSYSEQNVDQGIQTAIFTGFAGSTYYYKIFPYTNSGLYIDYKLDGSVPQFSITNANAPSLPITENFEYPTGSYLTDNGWVAHSGAGGSPIQVNASPLSYPGYINSGIGKSVTVNVPPAAEDVNRAFDSISTGSIYASFMVDVDSATTSGTYFFHLGPENSTFVYRARVFVKKNDVDDNLAFGVSKSSSSTAVVYTPFNYSLNTTYLIVVKYTFNTGTTDDDEVKLWINPVLDGIEPASDLTQTDTGIDPTSLAFFALRQGFNGPGLTFGGLRVATTWVPESGSTTFALDVTVGDGWNMVSVPGTNPAGMAPVDWWSNLVGDVYKFAAGYVAVTTTMPTEGYWLKNNGAETYSYPAIEIVTHNDISAAAGWNLIGGYELTVPTASLTTTPPGLLLLPIYEYSGGYLPATNIVPGYGYWAKMDAAGLIGGLSAPPLAKGTEPVEFFPENWGKIILSDATGINYTLYAVKGEVNLDNYELPPAPPAGMFDIRFGSGRIAEDINSSIQTIDMSGVTYPLTVRVEGMDIRLMDETGSTVNVNLRSGEDVVISDATIQKLMVTGELIPAVYALEQNYPNPFNPSTTIEFSLPEDVSNVKLSIYNALGEKIAELVNSSLAAGRYQYQWSAKNVATGMYIYELQTDKFVSVKKMLLLK